MAATPGGDERGVKRRLQMSERCTSDRGAHAKAIEPVAQEETPVNPKKQKTAQPFGNSCVTISSTPCKFHCGCDSMSVDPVALAKALRTETYPIGVRGVGVEIHWAWVPVFPREVREVLRMPI